MNAFSHFSALPMVHTLGWTLLHFCWQGTLAALLLACALALLPSRAALARYAAACIAMALMMVLPLLTFGKLAAEATSVGRNITVVATGTQYSAESSSSEKHPADRWLVRAVGYLDHAVPGIIFFWIAGVALFACRMNIGLIAAERMKRLALQPASPELRGMLQSLAARLEITKAVRLMYSIQVDAPAVIGWLKPVILIPAGCIVGLSASQIEALLAHELAHIRRHDYLVSLAQSTIETVFFFHPAVWWVSRQIRREREHCCDDLAVQVCGDRLAYAKALALLEQRRSAPAFAPGANGGNLKMRIARVLGIEQAPTFSRTTIVTLVSLAAITTGWTIIAQARAQPVTTAQQQSSSSVVNNRHGNKFQEWLNEDVHWIITPEERDTYLQLHSDQERLEFIRQFWERRNPNPGSAENKFKEEIYRRLAYANIHFAERYQPGWKTDRGHVYIAYGRPYSIDAYPQGSSSTAHPKETWTYQTIQISEPATENSNGNGSAARTKILNNFNFQFVDKCNCGEYQLQSPFPQ